MSKPFPVRVNVGDRSKTIILQHNAKIDELFQDVSEKCAGGRNPETFLLYHGDQPLAYNKGKTLEDYKMVENSTVTFAYRVPGGLEHNDYRINTVGNC